MAEKRSLERGIEDAIYLVRSLKEAYDGKVSEWYTPMEARTDNKNLYGSLQSTKQEQIKDGTMGKVMCIPNKEMITDGSTKANAKTNSGLPMTTGKKLN